MFREFDWHIVIVVVVIDVVVVVVVVHRCKIFKLTSKMAEIAGCGIILCFGMIHCTEKITDPFFRNGNVFLFQFCLCSGFVSIKSTHHIQYHFWPDLIPWKTFCQKNNEVINAGVS